MPLTFHIPVRLDRIAAEQSASRRDRIAKAAATKAARHAEQLERARRMDEQRLARLAAAHGSIGNGHVAEPFAALLNRLSGGE